MKKSQQVRNETLSLTEPVNVWPDVASTINRGEKQTGLKSSLWSIFCVKFSV